MADNITTQVNPDATQIEQGKVIALFQFIKELNKLKQKSILNLSDYPWTFSLSDLPLDSENIKLSFRDRVADDSSDESDVLLAVHKPEFQSCPPPDQIFMDWLEDGWDSYQNPLARIKDILEENNVSITDAVPENESEIEGPEHFADNTERLEAFEAWQTLRSAWVERQLITVKTRDLFTDLYRLYFELQRDSETMEIIVANGILCDREKPELKHPVLTHRVKLSYDADENTVTIEDTDASSELYSIAFQVMDDINLSAINEMSDDLQKNDYHPLDRNDTPGFLKALVHQLSSDSFFSEDRIPQHWMNTNRLLLYWEPVYIVRKRLDGTLKAIEQIIENIEETGDIPAPIRDLVSGGTVEIPEDDGDETIEAQLAAVGGESIDILLSKEANKEQLEIAKRIERYNAVLVQGPPGTGKTHTIANLMGHFLAQGKSILVTSHTKKALSVLKEKVAPGLQDLCVSILDDSNLDMERSVDGITDYMSRTTSHEVKREMELLSTERRDITGQLATVRRKLFAIINQECNCIVLNGEEISPSKAGAFVLEHADDLSYIPGSVRLHHPLPLTFEQLTALYHSNEGLSTADETELAAGIPSAADILSPEEFTHTWENYRYALKHLEKLERETGWEITNLPESGQIMFEGSLGTFSVDYPSADAVGRLKQYATSFGKIDKWMKCAAVDGKNGGAYRQRWLTLIEQIQKTCRFAEDVLSEQFGLDIRFANPDTKTALWDTLKTVRDILAEKGKIPFLTQMMHKEYAAALEAVTINGKPLQSAADCDIILHSFELEQIRKQCAAYWDELLAPHGVTAFYDLDVREQERVADNLIPLMLKYLDWYKNDYQPLINCLNACAFLSDIVFSYNTLDSDLIATEKILSAVETVIPALCDACSTVASINEATLILNQQRVLLTAETRGNSQCCRAVLAATDAGETATYVQAYAQLDSMYVKYQLQRDRAKMLHMLEPVAPQWADAIRNRVGIHGAFTVPSTIEDAWKWKQLSGIIDEITAQPFGTLQAESLRLSKEYRRITAAYAERCGWYHLLRTTESDISMKQALQGWKQTVKRIGKGTGKNAPALKAKARELMTKCQNAVPGWIMPIGRALESLNPKANRFDVIIIDEASQSDISSLAILYMGKKLIIVGDDKQVSPMAVGVEVEKMNALEQMYIKDKIPNSHLYNAKTSIYDIAATTFQPLMLREHFRCAPEIIGFSNMLSYDYKIKPLRDASSSALLPAVVSYRVADGQRNGRAKTNQNEARAIVALMRACMEQPEYKGKSMGVISLLGDEQVKLIQSMIEREIDPKELVLRSILCGNSANFQGDERDVIFLSMVDSGDGTGPIHLQNFGADDSTRKRYNVAASRARDQLWVVHSLDAASDLKPGDIRKTLLDYAANPHADEIRRAEIEKNADSPFEVAVASALAARGYHLVQQWKVGAYRLDMVAVCGKKTVAIECDGERWHSGGAKIREDMERQTILERLGWRFIRIRGSEYYRQPQAAIERVVRELTDFGIEPEESAVSTDETRNTELLQRVRNRAGIILHGEDIVSTEQEMDVIEAALGAKETEKAFGEIKNGLTTHTDRNDVETVQKPSEENPAEPVKRKANSRKQREVSLKPRTNTVMPDESTADANDVLSLLKENNAAYVDKRANGGALWIIGGHELDAVVQKARSRGVHFRFKEEGGKATKGKAGWWAK